MGLPFTREYRPGRHSLHGVLSIVEKREGLKKVKTNVAVGDLV
jgi:hypothetical protein